MSQSEALFERDLNQVDSPPVSSNYEGLLPLRIRSKAYVEKNNRLFSKGISEKYVGISMNGCSTKSLDNQYSNNQRGIMKRASIVKQDEQQHYSQHSGELLQFESSLRCRSKMSVRLNNVKSVSGCTSQESQSDQVEVREANNLFDENYGTQQRGRSQMVKGILKLSSGSSSNSMRSSVYSNGSGKHVRFSVGSKKSQKGLHRELLKATYHDF